MVRLGQRRRRLPWRSPPPVQRAPQPTLPLASLGQQARARPPGPCVLQRQRPRESEKPEERVVIAAVGPAHEPVVATFALQYLPGPQGGWRLT